MSIWYVDLDNGADGNDGTSWATAKKTITTGISAALVSPGDTIRISKTPDPISIGNAKWEDCPSGGFAPTTVNISSSTNATPIEITTSANHNLVTGDICLVSAHTTNYTANGNWQITYVSATKFTLDNSVGVGTGSSGTIRKINSKAVVLATAQTQNVVTTEGGWTGVGDTTISHVAQFCKSGYVQTKLSLDSSPQTSILQAYKAIPSTDFSSKQKISFWISNSSAISANQWYVALCSDTAGATPVDIFKIPAIPSTGRNTIISITKNGGGNLGSAIQSVAIYTDTVTSTASMQLHFENFQACTTNGLQGDSLISKNGSAQGGTEGYYGIQSINGKVVVLDNDTNIVSTGGRGYSGTSETVETFIRSTFKTAMAASSSTQVSIINDSGTFGNLIAYEFGYEVGTTNQNGETMMDGLNGNGYGIYASSKSFNSLNWCSCVRYNYGIYLESSHNNYILNISNITNNTINTYFSNCRNNYIQSLFNSKNGLYGVYFSSCYNNTISTITNTNNNTNTGIILASYSDLNVINTGGNIINNTNYAINVNNSANNYIKNILTINNGISSTLNDNTNYIRNSSLSESTEATSSQWSQGVLWSYDHDQTDGNHWGFFYGGTFNWQTSTKHSTEVGAWKTAITSADRKSNYKAVLKVAEIAGIANTNLTVTAWVKKDHATNIACRLVCYADTALNITEQADTKADDTDWEQLSITVNSDHANPVFEIFLETWYISGTSNTYVGTISIT